MNVGFHEDARDEYVAAIVWYERDYPGRGERFRAAVDRTLAMIASEPYAFAKRRSARCSRAPISVCAFFEITDAETIRVLAVAHAKRRPGYWPALTHGSTIL